MRASPPKSVRCAIYTRVSTEEQDFNSLDAQYDASQAYVRSQAHAGWTMLRAKYDDGGFSGGNTDRPALQRLLQDVQAGKIDVIVVYKVDRSSMLLTLPLSISSSHRRPRDNAAMRRARASARIGRGSWRFPDAGASSSRRRLNGGFRQGIWMVFGSAPACLSSTEILAVCTSTRVTWPSIRSRLAGSGSIPSS